MIDTHCARCLRPAPAIEADEYIEWEPLGEEAQLLVCPDCITPEEQQAMDEGPSTRPGDS